MVSFNFMQQSHVSELWQESRMLKSGGARCVSQKVLSIETYQLSVTQILNYRIHRRTHARLKHRRPTTFVTKIDLQIVEERISRIEMDVAGTITITTIGTATILMMVGLKFVMTMVVHCECEGRQHRLGDLFAAVMSTILAVEIHIITEIAEEAARDLHMVTETIYDIENEARALDGIQCKIPTSKFRAVSGIRFRMFRSL
jgi:hypothetical protein